MKEKVIKYNAEEIKVLWKPDLCLHAKNCWRGLPEVFKPKDKVWIQPDGVDDERIIEQVKKCPSGALSYELKSSGKTKEESSSVTAEVMENGPLVVSGTIQLKNTDGTAEEKSKAAFCRCGASNNKPFCDGSHVKVKFEG